MTPKAAKRGTASALCSTPSAKAARKRKTGGICARRGATKATPSPEVILLCKKRSFKFPTPPRARITRSSGSPTCCTFGVNQIQLYPEFFFCHNCDEWDKRMLRVNKRHNSTRSERYRCTAGHTSFYFPTRPKAVTKRLSPTHHDPNNTPSSVPDVQVFDTQLRNISPGDSSSPSSFSSGRDEEGQLTTRLRARIGDLERQLENNKKLINYYKSKQSNLTSNVNDANERSDDVMELDEAIIEAVNKVISENSRFRRYGKLRKERLIAKAVFDERFGLGMSLTEIVAQVKLWLRKNVFTPQAILKEMDLSGGTLNYQGLDVLRSVETKGKRYYRGSVLPSPACLKRAAKVVERKADEVCPMEEFETQWGKGIKLCEARTVKLVLDSFGLAEKAKSEKVSLSESIDASKITKNLSCITAGFKVTDIAAVDPVTKKALFVDGLFSNMQSRNNVFPLQMILAKETKESYNAFKSFFDFFAMASDKSISRDNTPYFWEALEEYNEFEVCATMDMSATWKGLKKGGACKRERYFCHACTCESDKVHHPNRTLCDRFCSTRDDPEWKCYHHSITTSEAVDQMKQDIEVLRQQLNESLEQVESGTKVVVYPDSHRGRISEKNSVDYAPTNIVDSEEFMELLSSELELRHLDISGTLEEMRQRLKLSLLHEAKLRLLLDEVRHSEGVGVALFLVMQAVPCILHCENRVCIKILTMLLIEGFSNAQAGTILRQVSNSKKVRFEKYIELVERILNTTILGDQFDPVQWECPTVENGLMVGAITLDNNRARKIVEQIDELCDISFADDGRKEQFKYCARKFVAATAIMRMKREFLDEDIISFQSHIDDFFQVWVTLFSSAGCTNYIHFLASGHIAEYMFRWRNLHRFSQQGWENFNSLLKVFFFRRTAHGGPSGGKHGHKSKLLPIGRWLQRRLLWICGVGEQLFSRNDDDIGRDPAEDEDPDIHI